ncbi:MAG: HEAT repeat domain-containing protein [Planctomycetales bacterium]|nr:HEAT repeat domain-containing protein [Planctomycetales bacterium]
MSRDASLSRLRFLRPRLLFGLIGATLFLGISSPASAQVNSPELRAAMAKLSSASADERAEAARMLKEIGPNASHVAPQLVARFKDNQATQDGESVSKLYAEAVGAMGPEVVDLVVPLLDSANTFELAGACEAIHQLGPDAKAAVPAILERLPTAEGDLLWGLVYGLSGIGPDAAPAVEPLRKLLEHQDFQVQIIACRALGGIGPEARAAVPKLVEMLETGVGSVKSHAALALASIGPQPDFDIPALIGKLVEHPQFVLKERSLEALGILGSEAQSQLPLIDRLWGDPSYNAQIPLAIARWKITGDAERSLALLEKLAGFFDTELDAVHAVALFGPEAKSCTEWLLPKLSGVDTDVAYEAAMALAAIGDASDEVLEQLAVLEMSDDEFAAAGATEAIRVLKAKRDEATDR